ncbi:MAG: SpoIIE family protein phosphatase [Gemmatimonadetes bacterium]|nr:SpoIIE family protein phosphatase [Gemmatimonadota bacterium]
MLPSLGALADATLRVWRLDDGAWLLLAGPPAAAPRAPREPGRADAAFVAMPDAGGLWLEVVPTAGQRPDDVVRRVMPVLAGVAHLESTVESLTTELASRYEEIDLIYTIGELLGRSQAVAEVADHILREVASVLGARQAGIRIVDEEAGVLRLVAIVGSAADGIPREVPLDAPDDVVVVRAVRTRRVETGPQAQWVAGEVLAVPMLHAAPGGPTRVVGTLALADRAGGGTFTREETKLLAAVATQIGTALENTRLAEREREQHTLERELAMAHDLQQKLMPTPAVLQGEADVAVTSLSAESLGGDFYTFARFGRGRIGVMLGDVSSHGFSAALIAAQVMAAAGIYANSAIAPDETLALIRESLGDELEHTEMYLTVFYGILEPSTGRLAYSNSGHPHAFRVPRYGPAARLAPTAPPLGLAMDAELGRESLPWTFGTDMLVLCTDGLIDQPNAEGERYGEQRFLEQLEEGRLLSPAELERRILADVAAFGGEPHDDTTLLILRM